MSERPKPLTILPEGELYLWTFSAGNWCGTARDSVAVRRNNSGCVLKREDVTALRKWLKQAEKSWMPNPPSFGEMRKQIEKGTKSKA